MLATSWLTAPPHAYAPIDLYHISRVWLSPGLGTILEIPECLARSGVSKFWNAAIPGAWGSESIIRSRPRSLTNLASSPSTTSDKASSAAADSTCTSTRSTWRRGLGLGHISSAAVAPPPHPITLNCTPISDATYRRSGTPPPATTPPALHS
ncbi:hypothetical protein CC85DRAFT_83952 [Cutaneotrichosporon oleaginosum]|uniref:Uncharacterized protein n=1 Tax=Cutaneotrichosporon oleaginosum TaxID=879819 RepID=A0A0J0XN63_9TREE|nr:uncharacterized protein CC85DRAFT_83952 [Cutaneotrichosporon oleaginosum]KLT42566.1 hypothetical protein CC85DRAFT_83952 [Cutaneotrichosporon oleaginosum]TXT15018.1 hypothetical protein COLE_01211 [Cutaneotrichosporon oleaginosum]